jgi:hypothetical protein
MLASVIDNYGGSVSSACAERPPSAMFNTDAVLLGIKESYVSELQFSPLKNRCVSPPCLREAVRVCTCVHVCVCLHMHMQTYNLKTQKYYVDREGGNLAIIGTKWGT